MVAVCLFVVVVVFPLQMPVFVATHSPDCCTTHWQSYQCQAARPSLNSNVLAAGSSSWCHCHRCSGYFTAFPIICCIMSAKGADCFFSKQLSKVDMIRSGHVPRPTEGREIVQIICGSAAEGSETQQEAWQPTVGRTKESCEVPEFPENGAAATDVCFASLEGATGHSLKTQNR